MWINLGSWSFGGLARYIKQRTTDNSQLTTEAVPRPRGSLLFLQQSAPVEDDCDGSDFCGPRLAPIGVDQEPLAVGGDIVAGLVNRGSAAEDRGCKQSFGNSFFERRCRRNFNGHQFRVG